MARSKPDFVRPRVQVYGRTAARPFPLSCLRLARKLDRRRVDRPGGRKYAVGLAVRATGAAARSGSSARARARRRDGGPTGAAAGSGWRRS